jgi:N-acetyl sugar amidotransferase
MSIEQGARAVMCTRCIYDSAVSKIAFDEQGVCNYCRLIEQLEQEYKTGTPEGEGKFSNIVSRIRAAGKGKKYDCVVGVSGGTDSSFMLHLAVARGLRPLAVHYDNTWNSAIATENIRKVTKKLKVDLFTHVVDNKEMDDIYRAFFLASVPEIDGPTDIALAEVLYRAANQFGTKYILEGHSFRAEGVSPLGYAYVDGKYIASIHHRFGIVKMKTFPNMDLLSFLKWITVKRIQKIRPFWYIAYSKEEARDFLAAEYGWQYYGGHHLENRMTAFNHSYYFPVKFNIDQRNNGLAAAVRSGKMDRDQALQEYQQAAHIEPELIEYFKKRLQLTSEEFNRIMALPPKCFRDYPTYKKTFEQLRPMFYILAKANLVPMSFYIKYCSIGEI